MDTPNSAPLSEEDLDAVAGGTSVFEPIGSPPVRIPIPIVDDDPFPMSPPIYCPLPINNGKL